MKNHFLFLIITFVFTACETDPTAKFKSISTTQNITADSLALRPNLGLVFYQNLPFTGTSVAHYPNGQVAETVDYQAGKKYGAVTKWFVDGTKSYAAEYQIGKLHGKSYTWWRNGNQRTDSNYQNGVAEGEQLQWYKSGALFKKQRLVAGKEVGLQQSWRANGKIYNNYEARNGRIFGLKRANLCYELDNEVVQYSDDLPAGQ
ncbi:MAG: toxin-antitoxin system YwqK family antitoxin [Saprospiraceae bacterium]